jgi:hypothetical protein
MCRKKLRKEQNLETLALVDRSVKDLSSTMQKFEDKEKQEGTPPPSSKRPSKRGTGQLVFVLYILKGLGHEMNNLCEGLENRISTFYICVESFKNFCCLVREKIKDKVLACSTKTLTNCETPSSNPLQIACCSIQR